MIISLLTGYWDEKIILVTLYNKDDYYYLICIWKKMIMLSYSVLEDDDFVDLIYIWKMIILMIRLAYSVVGR